MKNHYKLHLIKCNIFNVEEIKVDNCVGFSLKGEPSQLNDLYNSHSYPQLCENQTVAANNYMYPYYSQPRTVNQFPAINNFNFMTYLQNSFSANDLYKVFGEVAKNP